MPSMAPEPQAHCMASRAQLLTVSASAKAAIESGKTSYLHDVEYAAMQAMKEDVKKAIAVFSK